VEATTPSNQMDLDKEIKVINPKDKNVSPEERHKWRMPELPPVPKAPITVVRTEPFPAGRNRDIPVSVQELVYGGKAAGMGTSAKSLNRQNEPLSSSEEVHGPKKDRRASEGLDTHFLQGTSPTDKSLIKNQSMFNAEVETACNFEEIPRLEEWPTFSGEGEYNHMEF
ncbi:hypothetical protein O181_080795, partial [Austropuccinia psidii MF-1]|nr:hypothetical protein [Austropuccinia psidii MF-1]